MRDIKKYNKIYVAGHTGMIGSAIVNSLKKSGAQNIITKTSKELDLTNQKAVEDFFAKEKPDCVFFAAGLVGGLQWNLSEPTRFLYENTMMALNVIKASYESGVKFLLNVSSTCVYGNNEKQPYKEDYSLHGPFSASNEGYTMGKLISVKMCEMYNRQFGFDSVTVLLSNLYGINSSFDSEKSNVIGSLIERFHQAKINNDDSVVVWGSGAACREFLFTEDAGDGVIHAVENSHPGEIINIGPGKDIPIKELADVISDVIDFKGKIIWDTTKPDGVLRRRVCSDKQKKMGWEPKYSLEQGIEKTYEYYLDKVANNG